MITEQKYIDDVLSEIAKYKNISPTSLKIEYIRLFDTTIDLYRLSNDNTNPSKENQILIEDKCVETLFVKYLGEDNNEYR